MKYVMGIDLSLRSAGFVALPVDVTDARSPRRVVTETYGSDLSLAATEEDRLRRLVDLRDKALSFWRSVGRPSVAIEEYAFSSPGGSQAHAVGEAGGVVKVALYEAGADVVPVVSSQARKLLLGTAPRASREAKAEVKRAFVAVGFSEWTPDEYDAGAVANYLLAKLGYPCFASLPIERKRTR